MRRKKKEIFIPDRYILCISPQQIFTTKVILKSQEWKRMPVILELTLKAEVGRRIVMSLKSCRTPDCDCLPKLNKNTTDLP